MNNNLCAILIPIYKKSLNPLEKISFSQAKKVFKQYDIIAITPEKLYKNPNYDVKQECFDDEFFISVQTYSKLLLSKEFYQRFVQYKYVLIYQLDAFVFTDNLEYFCNLGYDYIGAPWIDGMMSAKRDKICFVGNGGLTLRNVNACINLIERYQDEVSFFSENEDIFFSLHKNMSFRVAPVKTALSFSIESKVERCFKRNKKKLPFGCHAWEKYDFNFWKPHIEKQGYVIDNCWIKDGDEDLRIERGFLRRVTMSLYCLLTRS